MDIVDIVEECLSLAPVPHLRNDFLALKVIWASVEKVEASKQQLRVLAYSVAQLLRTLDTEYRAARLIPTATSSPLADLRRLLDEISAYVHTQSTYNFLQSLYTNAQRRTRIEGYYQRLRALINSLEISSLLNVQDWQRRTNDARAADQQSLADQFDELEANPHDLIQAFDAQQHNMMAVLTAIQKRLDARHGGRREHTFLERSMQYLSTASGCQVQLEDWMITSYEVEFGQQIGAGGFGKVFKGNWNKTQVAIKVLKTAAGVVPSSTVICSEIANWSKIRHPHILQFLGANVLDERPFIVTPYLKNGNARDYIRHHPDCDRLRILHHISLGLIYLHSQKIVHGDLKAVNVLIDDNEKAVLCDFGLSQVRADATSRTAILSDAMPVAGSRNWMAPERLMGGSLRRPCDIYAFGIMIPEIYTNEAPLGHVVDFIDLVVQRDVRPERPEDDETPHLPDAVWALAEQCWVKEPKKRLTAVAICDAISPLLEKTAPQAVQTRPQPSPSSQSQLDVSTTSPLSINPRQADVIGAPPIQRLPPTEWTSNDSFTGEADGSTVMFLPAYVTFDPLPAHPMVQMESHTQPHAPINYNPLRTLNITSSTRMRGHTDAVRCAVFSPDGRHIASGSADGMSRLWDATSGDCTLGPLQGYINGVWSIAFSPDGSQIACGSSDSSIRVWNVQTGNRVSGPFKGHTGVVWSVSYSPDSRQFVTGSIDKTIRVWDAWTGRKLAGPFKGHTGPIASVAFSPDGSGVVSGSDDTTIRVWNAKTGKLEFQPLVGHKCAVPFVAFSSDGRRIVSGSMDRAFCVWDAGTGALLSGPSERHAEGALAVAFTPSSTSLAVSPDGKWIVGSPIGNTRIVQVWDSKTGILAATFEAHTDLIWSVAFSPDGKRIVTASDDQTVHVCTLD